MFDITWDALHSAFLDEAGALAEAAHLRGARLQVLVARPHEDIVLLRWVEVLVPL